MYHSIFKPKHPPDFELLKLKNVCRICLHCTNKLVSLFNNGIDSLVSEFLPEKLNRNPLQPHQICTKCLEEAKSAYKFKKQCQYSDKLIKSQLTLDETDLSETFEKQTQTDFINFIHPCDKCEKFHAIVKAIFSCENCLEIFECEDDLTNHMCPISFSGEKSIENDPLNEFHLETEDLDETEEFCKDRDETNFSECDLKSEDSFKNYFNENLDGKFNQNISVKLDIEIIDDVKATEDVVRSMIKESEKRIIFKKGKVKPNTNGKYECETCKKVFSRSAYYWRHQIIHSECPKPYFCTMCTKSYSSPSILKHHVNGFHANLRPFKCLPCGKAYTTNVHLKRHIVTCSLATESVSDKEKSQRLTKDKIFGCHKCLRKFSIEKCLQDHIASQHDENREFTCKYCKQKVIGASEYKKHCKGHYTALTKKFLCSECGKSFRELRYLLNHTKTHGKKDDRKLCKCRYCDKSFSQGYLHVHERLHTGGKGFHCTTCSKSFLTPYKLQMHTRTHTGERLHKCLYCPKLCLTGERLRIHTRMHTGERPYKCSYCPKAFSQRADLIVHHRRHTGERFYCDVCGSGFIQKYLLRRHRQKAHNINDEPDKSSLLKNQKQKTSEDKDY